MSKWPELVAGTPFTARDAGEMVPEVVIKYLVETRQSTTTLTADAELGVYLEANAVYYVELYAHYATTSAADNKFDWTAPTGAVLLRAVTGASFSASETNLDNVTGRFGVHGITTAVGYGDRNGSNQAAALETAIVTTQDDGVLRLRWAQNTSTAADTSVNALSFMVVTRLA